MKEHRALETEMLGPWMLEPQGGEKIAGTMWGEKMEDVVVE